MKTIIENPKLYKKLSPKFEEKGDCILWTGFKRVQIDKQLILPQRAVVFAFYDKTPKGAIQLYCDNRNCVNLEHMLFERDFNPAGKLAPTDCVALDANMFYDNKSIFAELKRVVRDLKREPTKEEWATTSRIPVKTICYRFKTWHKFLKKLKEKAKKAYVELKHEKQAREDSKELKRVSNEIKRVAELLGHKPSEEDFLKHGTFSLIKIRKVFKTRSWKDITKNVFGVAKKKTNNKTKRKSLSRTITK